MSDDTYFDYAASAPPFPEALRRFDEVSLQFYGNPSSTHGFGKKAREALDRAREAFLARLGLHDGRLILTSGATEANNLILRDAMEGHPSGRLLLAADAHPSAWFAKDLYGKRVDVLPVDSRGRISPRELEERISRKTVLVSVVHANNETGVVQDVRSLGEACARKKVPMHVDGVQAVGHLPLTLSELPFAFYTFSAHKFGGPRGVGGVLTRGDAPGGQILGGGQERGARGGTENVAGLAAAVVALDLSARALEAEVPRLRALARSLAAEIRSSIPDAVFHSDPESGLPGLVCVSFPPLAGEEIVLELDLRGYEASAGSACGSGKREPSRPLLAMGRPRAEALGTVRISMGRFTTPESAAGFAAALRQVVEKQKALA